MFAHVFGITAFSLVIGAVLVHAPLSTIDISHSLVSNIVSAEKKDVSLFFVGDIMLGRGVEGRIIEEGITYPFKYVKDIISESDLAIGNFEGVVTERHRRAPSMTFQFSIRNEYLTQLKNIGFDVLSLANNHSFDYGIEALEHTRSLCNEIHLACPGSPNAVGRYSLHTETVDDITVGFIAVHAALTTPVEEDLVRKLEQLKDISDVQIAYIHWGVEYERDHTRTQERLAERMIDHGVDAVFGHHPHVVEDVEIYKNAPIFYSLGNFIFDQYFSDDVQEGLGVEMSITDTSYEFKLHPFTSKESRNQPRPMESKEAHALFERILEPVREHEGIDVDRGLIILPRS
jgi:poly-gamma-glutamate capsule biosynthesis protein CapA/YwtB (metallophosphatase superfamily)